MTKFRCTVCQSQYHRVAAALRGYQCHGSPLQRPSGPAAGPNGRSSIPAASPATSLAAPDPSELRVLSITLPRQNERDHKAVTNLLSSLMTGQPFSLEMLGDGSGRRLLARGSCWGPTPTLSARSWPPTRTPPGRSPPPTRAATTGPHGRRRWRPGA